MKKKLGVETGNEATPAFMRLTVHSHKGRDAGLSIAIGSRAHVLCLVIGLSGGNEQGPCDKVSGEPLWGEGGSIHPGPSDVGRGKVVDCVAGEGVAFGSDEDGRGEGECYG